MVDFVLRNLSGANVTTFYILCINIYPFNKKEEFSSYTYLSCKNENPDKILKFENKNHNIILLKEKYCSNNTFMASTSQIKTSYNSH